MYLIFLIHKLVKNQDWPLVEAMIQDFRISTEWRWQSISILNWFLCILYLLNLSLFLLYLLNPSLCIFYNFSNWSLYIFHNLRWQSVLKMLNQIKLGADDSKNWGFSYTTIHLLHFFEWKNLLLIHLVWFWKTCYIATLTLFSIESNEIWCWRF